MPKKKNYIESCLQKAYFNMNENKNSATFI